jgi:hypothetical protein
MQYGTDPIFIRRQKRIDEYIIRYPTLLAVNPISSGLQPLISRLTALEKTLYTLNLASGATPVNLRIDLSSARGHVNRPKVCLTTCFCQLLCQRHGFRAH